MTDPSQSLGTGAEGGEVPRGTSGRERRLLGVFAHPDDEVFCAGGTLARYTAAGAEAMVISLTRGEAGQIRDAAIATRRSLGRVREEELQRSCDRLGVQHARCFDFGDGRLAEAPLETLVEPVTAIIRDFRPDIVITFDETGGYGHPDHIAACQATGAAYLAAGDAEQFPAQELAPHTPARLYHSYFPRNRRMLLRLLSDWLEGLDSKFRGSTEFVHGLMLFADESSMLGYASDHIEVKWFPRGFYIIEQGEPAVSLYLILSGRVDILVEDARGEVELVANRGAGIFVGETGIAYGQPRNAHVVAAENVTCLVFTPGEPTHFAGRGEGASQLLMAHEAEEETPGEKNKATTDIDVTAYVGQKVAAMSEHRSQYPITPDMFPAHMLEQLLGHEYFVQVQPPPAMAGELLPGLERDGN